VVAWALHAIFGVGLSLSVRILLSEMNRYWKKRMDNNNTMICLIQRHHRRRYQHLKLVDRL